MATKTDTDLAKLLGRPTTGEVAARLGVTEARIQTVLRTTPSIRPRVVGRRRRWSPKDIRALRARMRQLGDL